MKRPFLSRDILLLSSYLDNQLSESQKKKIELRLEQEKALRIAFDDLRLTRAALKRAPQAKVPHNFILTPEMLKTHRKSFVTSLAMRLISSVASILFVIVFVGDFIIGFSLSSENSSELLTFSASDMVEEEAGAMRVVDLDDAESVEIIQDLGENAPLEAPSALAEEGANFDDERAESVEGVEPTTETEIVEEVVAADSNPTEEKYIDEQSVEVQDNNVETNSDETNNIGETLEIIDADQNLGISDNELSEVISKNGFQYSEIVEILKWFLAILAILTGLLSYLLRQR